MNKLAISIAVIALAAALGIASPAKADPPFAETAGTCGLGKIFDAVTGHCHNDSTGGGPLELGDFCGGALTEDTKILKTVEAFGGSCTIDLDGNDLTIQQATIDITSGDLTIDDVTGGAAGRVRIVASDIDVVAGNLIIALTTGPNGDISISHISSITVGPDKDVTLTGRTISVRDSMVTSDNSGGTNVGVLTMTGTQKISVKDNAIDGFATVAITTTNNDVFVFDNDFDGAAVTIINSGNCSWKSNLDPEPSACP